MKKSLKIILAATVMFCCQAFIETNKIMAQNYDMPDYSNTDIPRQSNWFYSGNVNVNWGRSINTFEVSPSIGYFIVPNRFLIGISAYYTYYSYKNIMDNYEYNSKASYIGVGVFSRYYLHNNKYNFINNIFAHAEYEYLTVIDKYEDSDDYVNNQNNKYYNPLVGIGYEQKIGRRLSLDFLLLFSLLPKEKSPYSNPIFRLGFSF